MFASDELAKLADLHQRGALSDEEFTRAKARVLGSGSAATAAPGCADVNRLRRSRSDRWVGGVCGGLAGITGMDSWVWRLLFTLLALFAGGGVLLYLLLWIFVPQE